MHQQRILSSPRRLHLATVSERTGHAATPAARPATSSQIPAASQTRTEDALVSKGDVRGPQAKRSGERYDVDGDAYHTFREEALQLTRRWQRAAHKATSAFSGAGERCASYMPSASQFF
jgi:hypothetical protein